ncbi:MAG: hypothetical protein H6Q67_1995 [Firmicutes bacterium]|nr:hypothetical protein [Bacillota bacterium]
MKVVMIINKDLPIGLIANTAAVLGVSLGKYSEDIVGYETKDADGNMHLGITNKSLPILGANSQQIKDIRETLFEDRYSDIQVIDFSSVAQKSLNYDNYTAILATMTSSELEYLGICLSGNIKKINSLTGNLGLLK